MWGALRGNGLIRTFPVGIRCSSRKMREKVYCEPCFLGDVIFCSWKALAIFRAWQQEYQRWFKPVGTMKGSTKGRTFLMYLLCCVTPPESMGGRAPFEMLKAACGPGEPLIISVVWYHRISFSTAPLLHPAETSLALEIPFAFHVSR